MILTTIDELQNLKDSSEDIIVLCKDTDSIPIALLNQLPQNCKFESFSEKDDLYKMFVSLYVGQLLTNSDIEIYNVSFLNDFDGYTSKQGYKISLYNQKKPIVKTTKKSNVKTKVDKESKESKENKEDKIETQVEEIKESPLQEIKQVNKPVLTKVKGLNSPDKLFDKLKELSSEEVDLMQYKFLVYDSLVKSSSSKTLETKLVQNLGEEKAKKIIPLLKTNYIDLKNLL